VFEAVKMGTRIALLDAGTLQQLDTPSRLVEQPANEFVDQSLGQHRFQLTLITRSVASILGEKPAPQPSGQEERGPRLRPQDSLVEALDLFKRTGKPTLAVFQRSGRSAWPPCARSSVPAASAI
jgi:osmoprotectant transport system ATP-binding protein